MLRGIEVASKGHQRSDLRIIGLGEHNNNILGTYRQKQRILCSKWEIITIIFFYGFNFKKSLLVLREFCFWDESLY